MQDFNTGVDVLASGIHDAKNRLFEAQTLLGQAETEGGTHLADARLAIGGAATRLSRTLVAYRLLRNQQAMEITPFPVEQLVEDALITVRSQFERTGTTLDVDVRFGADWPLDRTLVVDVIVNALQNACRHANSAVRLEIQVCNECLQLRVNDDGAGFLGAAPGRLLEGQSSQGLFIAHQIAHLHERKGVRGSLSLANGGPLGGALFELLLP